MKKLLLALMLTTTIMANAQTEADIRKYYQEVNAKIAESVASGYDGPLYQNRWVTNSNSKSWPAVGRFSDTVDCWYDDPPDHLPATERDPKKVLVKVVVNGISSDLYRHEEYLFRNGVLLFYFSDDKEEGMGIETRVWFNSKGAAIKKNVRANELEIKPSEPEYKDIAPNVTRILQRAKKYQDAFVKTML
jgi:hypothetical protein